MSAKKRSYYKHALSEQVLPKEDLLAPLVIRLRAGDLTVINEIISHRIRLALAISGYYSRRWRSKIDDIVSVALLALTDAVNKAPTALVDDNLDAYLTKTIAYEINYFLTEDKMIQIPRTSKRRNNLPDIPVTSYNKKNKLKSVEDETIENEKEYDHSYTPSKEADYILELLGTVCNVKEEKLFIRYKIEGYTNKEVAEKLGLFESQVSRMRKDLEQRFFAKYGGSQ